MSVLILPDSAPGRLARLPEFDPAKKAIEFGDRPAGPEAPEDWVPGVKAPSLPARWPKPVPGAPLPFPSECQLNPLLVHNKCGPSELAWPISWPADLIALNLSRDLSAYLLPPDLQQPATYLFVTHFYINAVTDDPAPKFRWPIHVRNENGVRCFDIWQAIYECFQQFITPRESQDFSPDRQEFTRRAYFLRQTKEKNWKDITFVPGIRRCDYYGAEGESKVSVYCGGGDSSSTDQRRPLTTTVHNQAGGEAVK